MAPALPFNKRKIRLHLWVANAVMTILLSSCAFAQMDTAILVGRVADSSGAAIWRAQVELIDIERNTRSRVQTNATGLYLFPNTKPGHYRLNVSAPGYKTVVLTSLTIYVQDDIQQNFSMAAGSPLESVTLATNGTPVETTGTLGTVVDQTLVRELPLNGRSFQTLFQLTPGVVITPTTFASQGQFSVNGQRTNTNYFIIDGVSANVAIAAGVNPGQSAGGSLPAVTAFGGTNSLVSTDDVQEFAVLTSSYSPEFGRMPGAQVSIVTRSGTNEFHGELFDYIRNDALDANDWFANRDNLKRAALRQNDYGAVIGGPVLKGKSFFFVSYEGIRLRQPTSKETDVPSLAARGTSPESVKQFLNAYPLPNGPDQGNGLAQATYAFSDPSSLDTISLRDDHYIGEHLTVFGRYDHSLSERKQRAAAVNSLSTVTDTHFTLQTFTTGWSYQASPTIVSDLRFNWSRLTASNNDSTDSFGGAVPFASQLAVPSAFSLTNSLFQFLPDEAARNIGLSLGKNVGNQQSQVNCISNFSAEFQAHVVKTGIDVRWLSPRIAPANYTQAVGFADIASTIALRSLFTSVASNSVVNSSFRSFSGYLQDKWRLFASLSVSYGVRWDYNPTPDGRGDNGLHPFALDNTDNLAALSLALPGDRIYRSTWNNFAPRLGIAYDFRNSSPTASLLKAGIGAFYDLGNGPAGNAFDGTHFPFSEQKLLLDAPFPLNPRDASPPSISTNPPYGTVAAFPRVLKLPYVFQWNIALQQSVGREQAITIAYVGAAGHSLLRTDQFEGGVAGVSPNFTQVFFTNNAGYSRFDSLQVQFQKRVTKGMNAVASYSFSHSLDNISTDATFNSIPSRFLDRHADYASSDFDIRHTATAGLNFPILLTNSSKSAKSVFSNWLIDSVVTMRSSPTIDVVVLRQAAGGIYAFRPDVVSGAALYIEDRTTPGGKRFNVDALVVPATFQQGDLGRNFFRGFALFQTDLALRRQFRFAGSQTLEIRWEAFNIFNHPNFGPELGQLGMVDSAGQFTPQPGFGVSQGAMAQALQNGSLASGFSRLYQIGSARSMQLAVKIGF